MTLDLIESFAALAEEGHFGRAAERVFVTQPTFSRRIQRLEEAVGVRLVDRSGHGASLTPAGAAYLEKASQALSLAESAREAAVRAARGDVGHLAVGYVGPAVYGVLPALLRGFRDACPDVEVVVRAVGARHQAEAIRTGQIDVGISGARPEGMRSDPIAHDRTILALPAGHALAEAVEVDLGSVAAEPFVLISRAVEPALFDALIAMCRDAGFSPLIRHQVEDVAALLGMVAGGLGIAFVPRSVQGSAAPSAVAFAGLRGDVPRATYRVVWDPGGATPTARRFAEVAATLDIDL